MWRRQTKITGVMAAALLILIAAPARIRSQPAEDQIGGLIDRLNDSRTAWSAGAGLQKLGSAAVPALLVNLGKHPPEPRCDGRPSDTMQVLIKIGAPAIPYIVEDYFRPRSESVESRPVANPLTLIDILGRIGPPAIPALVDIAERATSWNQADVLGRTLGAGHWPLFDDFDNPWAAIGPARQERDLHGSQLIPLIPRLRKMMDTGVLEWQPHGPAPQLACAFALARWGDVEAKTAAVNVLLELAKSRQPFYDRLQPLAMLTELRVSAASELIARNIPGKEESDLADQYQLQAARQLYLLGDPAFFKLVVPLFRSNDLSARRSAISFAAQTLELKFVPELIERLNDSSPTGGQTVGPGNESRREELREEVLRGLERMTLQSFGPRPELWRRWWRENESTTRAQLVRAQVTKWLSSFATTPYWEMNTWMSRLAGTYDPAVIPLVRRYINHPHLNVRATGPESGTYTSHPDMWPWGNPPTAVTLLLGLSEKGNRDATRLLYDCLRSVDREVREFAAVAISTFDRQQATDFLVREMEQWASLETAEMLLHLGDARGVPGLISFLQHASTRRDEVSREMTYDELREFTQEDISYDPAADAAQRDEGIQRWWAWWLENERTFRVKVNAASLDRETLALFRERATRGEATPTRR